MVSRVIEVPVSADDCGTGAGLSANAGAAANVRKTALIFARPCDANNMGATLLKICPILEG